MCVCCCFLRRKTTVDEIPEIYGIQCMILWMSVGCGWMGSVASGTSVSFAVDEKDNGRRSLFETVRYFWIVIDP